MKQGDIILVPFPFSNLQSVKTRPALVISNSSFKGDDLIICGISSVKSGKQEVVLENQDLSRGALPLKSYVKYGKVVCLDKSIIKRVVAHCKPAKTAEIIGKVVDLIRV